MITTLCDYCGQPIEVGDQIDITVIDRRSLDLAGRSSPRVYHDKNLNLHHQCYVDHYQAAVEQKR